MLRKYIKLPAEYLFFNIMKIIYIKQSNEKKSEKLKEKIGNKVNYMGIYTTL